MTKTVKAARIPEFDGLRGLAILLVILCHYVGNPGHSPLGFLPNRFLLAFTVGWSGVDLFFVLSGFLIGGILLDARNISNYFRAFYMRRVFRHLTHLLSLDPSVRCCRHRRVSLFPRTPWCALSRPAPRSRPTSLSSKYFPRYAGLHLDLVCSHMVACH